MGEILRWFSAISCSCRCARISKWCFKILFG